MIGVVLAGGDSRRFGGQAKGLLPLNGRAMALLVADVLTSFCTRVVIEARAGAGYEALGLPVVHAPVMHEGKGPLAGLAAGLSVAEANEYVAFAPCDMPLVTGSVYAALTAAGGLGAYAKTRLGVEPLVAVLSARVRPGLLRALDGEPPRTHVVLDEAGAGAILFDDLRPFTNVNTPEDLEGLAGQIRRPRSSV